MKTFYMVFVVFAVLLVAASVSFAQDSTQECPWGATYDPLANGYMPACFGRPAATAASKPVGLAAPAVAVGSEEGWPGCPWGVEYDPIANGYVPACFVRPAAAVEAASKPVGLAAPAPVAGASQAGQGCPWGYPVYDPAIRLFMSQCSDN